jgi:hypothetical protein
VKARDQPREGVLRSGAKFRDQSRFFGLKRQCAGNIAHGERHLQTRVFPPYRKSRMPVTSPVCEKLRY